MILNAADINWIGAASYYSLLWMGYRSHLLRESISQMAKQLHKHGCPQALVQQDKIREFTCDQRGTLTAILNCQSSMLISIRRKAPFKAEIDQKLQHSEQL